MRCFSNFWPNPVLQNLFLPALPATLARHEGDQGVNVDCHDLALMCLALLSSLPVFKVQRRQVFPCTLIVVLPTSSSYAVSFLLRFSGAGGCVLVVMLMLRPSLLHRWCGVVWPAWVWPRLLTIVARVLCLSLLRPRCGVAWPVLAVLCLFTPPHAALPAILVPCLSLLHRMCRVVWPVLV